MRCLIPVLKTCESSARTAFRVSGVGFQDSIRLNSYKPEKSRKE
jgi:hypothetical protein